MQKLGNSGISAKSTNNSMSSFGLSEQNMELSTIYQAVRRQLRDPHFFQNCGTFNTNQKVPQL